MLAKYHRPKYIDLVGLVDDPDFLSLRRHLDPEIQRIVVSESGTDDNPLEVRSGAEGISANADLERLAGEVDRLERKWKLV